MTSFRFGPLLLDAVEFASQGNAILGIRDSGKTYTATALAEKLFDAGVPFFAFDPIGVWRWLRVPGKGHGYPVVVAGGKTPDLPLTVDNAAELTRQAMSAGVSVVFDLFSLELSKADWRRIVTAAVRTMLHENQSLRHVFIEEAAEFVPQRPTDFITYAELEKLARMGRNSRLGYTLINQRSQEVAKAILELCENVFLHRQRASHAIQALDKWLSIADAKERHKIVASLPDLPRGKCWAWLGGDTPTPPQLIEVPVKSSLHPDARTMHGSLSAPKGSPVNVAEFIARMQRPSRVPRHIEESDVTEEEADRLRGEITRLTQELAAAHKANARLTSGVAQPAQEERVRGPVPLGYPQDIDAIFEEVKRRLTAEAPALLRIVVEKPELEVKIERKTISVDGSSLKGRIAQLLAKGFFDDGRTNGATRTELARTGSDVHPANLGRAFEALVVDGFLTNESDKTYKSVEGMKVNII